MGMISGDRQNVVSGLGDLMGMISGDKFQQTTDIVNLLHAVAALMEQV